MGEINIMFELETQGFTLEELKQHFFTKNYSEQTKSVIIDIFHRGEKPAAVAKKYNITPQRVNSIRKMFLENFIKKDLIYFEGAIRTESHEELEKFAKLCKYVNIVNTNPPPRKIFI